MTTDDARDCFTKYGLSYKDIHKADIDALWEILSRKIKQANKEKVTSVQMRMSKAKHIDYNEDSSIRSCYLYVNADYFLRRECISFNPDGFIGFAGWSDSKNLVPILDAFCAWCYALMVIKGTLSEGADA